MPDPTNTARQWWQLMNEPRPYRITTTQGQHHLMARSRAGAISAALELAGPGAKVLSCLLEGEW